MNDQIAQLIPHRPPFLFLDELVEVTPERLTARLRVRPDFDFFRGHYPGNPIMPGVLISEAVFQAGALFLVKALAGQAGIPPGAVPVLARIQDARFRSIVRPGDELTIEVRLRDRMGKYFLMSGAVRVGERRVMSVDFGVALTDAESAAAPGAGAPG